MTDDLDDLAKVVSQSQVVRHIPLPSQINIHVKKMGCVSRVFWIAFGTIIAVITLVIAWIFFDIFSVNHLPTGLPRGFDLPHPVTPIASDGVPINYDKFKDISEIEVGSWDDPKWAIPEHDSSGNYSIPATNAASFNISCSFSGHTITRIDWIYFLFYKSSGMDEEKIFLVDGQRIRVDSHFVSPSDALLIARGKSVEFQCGETTYKLTPFQQSEILKLLNEVGVK